MASSILDRVGLLISANVNALIDRALRANSPAVLDEYIRRMEDNLEALEDAAAIVGGEGRTLQRKHDDYARQLKDLDRQIDMALSQGKNDLATAAQSRWNTMDRLAKSYGDQAAAQKREFDKLMGAKLKLEAKLTDVRHQREELLAMLQLAKSKEAVNKAVRDVGALTTDTAGLDDMRDQIQKRLDVANAQSEMDASRLETQMDELLETAAIDDQLAARRKRLGLEQ
jgi:phage shock protein A